MRTRATKTKSRPSAQSRPQTGPFVVAIGASAGGLEALERFFKSCPPSLDTSFVVIQHLSPDHKSMMLDLLSRYTSMPVVMVEDGMSIETNKVYLIPPGTIMRVHDQMFRLTPKAPHLLTLPIDIFLLSLADAFTAKAIAIILSGTGSDGTRGCLAINAAGGLVLAQQPNDAKFDGMPTSVINSGIVDDILACDALPARVAAHIQNGPLPQITLQSKTTDPAALSANALEEITDLLLQASGIDFHEYKPATFLRRIERRLQVRRIARLENYFHLLHSDAHELDLLRKELLIPVTSFFRDTEAFEELAQQAIAAIVSRSTGAGIRVWSAGVSTGEEAYTLAMLFLEEFERQGKWLNLKIFATDVNEQNIETAATGKYPESTAAELTEERLNRFFTQQAGAYCVKPELRQCIVFARHNLLIDPPFTRMSLVSCRNTLIYFNPSAQKHVLATLQYALEPLGYLFLGSSESLGGMSEGFKTLHSKYKIYQRDESVVSARNTLTGYSTRPLGRTTMQPLRTRSAHPLSMDRRYVDLAINHLLERYTPASLLVNAHSSVVHVFGNVQPFLQFRSGVASLELSQLLPEPLRSIATALIGRASRDGVSIGSDAIHLKDASGQHFKVQLTVQPLEQPDQEKLFLLSFGLIPNLTDLPTPTLDINSAQTERMTLLQQELAATRESLQTSIEELETSNEELQATNEELMASNEELQSSNEELQSLNEELNTVNAEFQEKVGILNRINLDLDMMLRAVGVATIFVDTQSRLTRFNPDATSIFRLRDNDIGRPLEEITHTLEYEELIEDLERTLQSGHPFNRECRSRKGLSLLVRMLPYGGLTTASQGVVLTFLDISAYKDRDHLQSILDALPEHIAVLSPEGTIVLVNHAWNRFAKANGDPELLHTGIGANYLDCCESPPPWPDDKTTLDARLGIKGVLEGSLPFFSMQYPCHAPNEERWFVMSVAPMRAPYAGAVVSHTNISAWQNALLQQGGSHG